MTALIARPMTRFPARLPARLLPVRFLRAALVATVASTAALAGWEASAEPVRGLAMHGEPAAGEDGPLTYVNPDAPKGGSITYGVRGTFDSLNPWVLKSMRTTARGMNEPEFGQLTFESLMMRSRDEPFTVYGLLAESVEIDDERTQMTFNLHPDAKWSDGEPVTPEDVIFTFDLLTEKGRPPYNRRMAKIESIEKTGDRAVTIRFNEESDREFPLIVAMMPVLPAHATDVENFEGATLDVPVTSGPYAVSEVDPGRSITFERREDYWGADLPVKAGFDNYDSITIEYFQNPTALFEAFKKGIVDVYTEGNPRSWESEYDFARASAGEVEKQVFEGGKPSNMLGFFMNTRRAPFDDAKVREAMAMLFDFEWVNANLFDGLYARTGSFWQNSPELSALSQPASEAELALLGEAADGMDPAVLDGTYRPPVTDGSGRDRAVLREALGLFQEAGYTLEGRQLVKDGQPLSFELLVGSPDEEKMALAYQRTLQALGIQMEIRLVDDAQFQKRRQSYDYDMVAASLSASLSPGAEQVWRWGTESRDVEGSFNFSGVADPVIDRAIDAMVNARGREDFAAAVRALDRLLISGNYVVPLYHLPGERKAFSARLAAPEKTPLYGARLDTWWDETASN